MGNTYGELFRITTFGESHGGAVGAIIDGCPAGIKIDLVQVQTFLNRRKPGQSHLSTPRAEQDLVECLSGLENSYTLGTPISLIVRNKDAKKDHYDDMQKVFRPSHADYTTYAKFGIRASSGGGRASARETIGRVAAAGIAEQVLEKLCPDLKVVAFVERVKDQAIDPEFDMSSLNRSSLDSHPLRAPEGPWRDNMESAIISAKKKGNSVGGSIRCVVTGVPVGLGEPVFDKLQAELAKAMMSLPATRSFEIGLGKDATYMLGSEHNDAFTMKEGKVATETNRSGGIQGGISNGEMIYFSVGFKPVATIFKDQQTVTQDGKSVTFKPKAGRHDPCVLPRAVPMVEAMTSLTLMDHFLRQIPNENFKN